MRRRGELRLAPSFFQLSISYHAILGKREVYALFPFNV
jgi:hypothetical protein